MSNELTNKQDSQLPAYMQEEILGTESLDKYVRPPRIKVIQPTARPPFDTYTAGDLVLVPQMLPFADSGVPFNFVPLFFYPEWLQTRVGMDLVGQAPFLVSRSLDPRSELAAKARNPDTWFEADPEHAGQEIKNCEVMNFVGMPYGDHPMAGTMCVLSFSNALFREGSNLAAMIKMRKASIFGQVFEIKTSQRTNTKGKWFGFDIAIPDDTKWVTEEEYAMFKEIHQKLEKDHAAGLIQVDYEDGETAEQETETEF